MAIIQHLESLVTNKKKCRITNPHRTNIFLCRPGHYVVGLSVHPSVWTSVSLSVPPYRLHFFLERKGKAGSGRLKQIQAVYLKGILRVFFLFNTVASLDYIFYGWGSSGLGEDHGQFEKK